MISQVFLCVPSVRSHDAKGAGHRAERSFLVHIPNTTYVSLKVNNALGGRDARHVSALLRLLGLMGSRQGTSVHTTVSGSFLFASTLKKNCPRYQCPLADLTDCPSARRSMVSMFWIVHPHNASWTRCWLQVTVTRTQDTPTEKTPPTPAHTRARQDLQTNTSHKHLTTLNGGATTVRATSHAQVGGREKKTRGFRRFFICLGKPSFVSGQPG